MANLTGDGAPALAESKSLRMRIFDLVFLVGVFVKGIDGLVEVASGTLLLVVSPKQLLHTAHAISAKKLGEDPDDVVANLLVHGVAHFHGQSMTFLSLYLLLHGLVKLAIVVALIAGSSRVYPWAIAALLLFLVYQAYEVIVAPSPLIIALTLLDATIVLLTWREWRNHRTLRDSWRETRAWISREPKQ